ncbi:hypothetical protein [Halalkalicoccus subterraneus]|uniref:hypothetical protein n=1 Tax=Halalkalicoccus subterraneus TaxID=2675002 RepID=UPI000EFCF16F|nr:hypothetical protein [Halalkalicoccus subterraneus]
MSSRRKSIGIQLGIFAVVLLVGIALFIVSQPPPDTPNGETMHIESYPSGPEKPSPLNSSSAVNYTVTYEERLFYNDLLASNNHRFDSGERVVADCTNISVSNTDTDGFRVRLECGGGVTDASQLPESKEFTYSVTYRITEDATEQAELQKYPFETDRRFNNERT